MNRLYPALLISLSVLASAAPCFGADQPASDPAAAEALFEEGRRALDSGDLQTACAKFAESQRLDPGAGTLMNWATCEERLGRIATAWQLFEQALDTLPPDDDRVEFARQRAIELHERLPFLTLEFPAPPPAGTVVYRDGIALAAASIGSSLPVDPGRHDVVVRSPGRAESRFFVSLAEREKRELLLHPGALVPRNHEPQKPPILGWTLLGIGATGVGAGVATSVLIERDKGIVERHCEAKLCDETGKDAADRGETLVWVNAAAYGVGAVALGTGLYLVLKQPKERPNERPSIKAGPIAGGGFVGYGGRF
jgi:hypothetical protein